MPSRKQRKRRAKDRRHEWEYVYVDDETGEEVEAPEDTISRTESARRSRRSPRLGRPRGAAAVVRKVGKRGLLFAPLMFLTVTFLSGDLTMTQRLVNTGFLLAFFLPFSYAMDALMYRIYKKRAG